MWLGKLVRSWAERRGITLLSVGYSNDWAHKQLIDCAPTEFPRVIAGAHAVVTNFFHGCVFALLHGKPWAACPSDYRAIKIPDLAALLGVEQRLIDEQTPPATVAELLETPLQPEVSATIDRLRARSNGYLDAALA